MTSGGGVVLREKRRYVLRRGCPGEACEELDHVEVLLGGGADEAHHPCLGGGSPPGPGIDAVVCEEGEQGLFLGVEVLCELAVLVVGLSVVGEHRDALCEVG